MYAPATDFSQLRQETFTAIEMLNQQVAITYDRLLALEKALDKSAEVESLLLVKEREIKLQRVEEVKEGLRLAVEAGKLVEMGQVFEDSMIVGVEYDASGNEVFPGHVQNVVAGFNEDARAKLVGSPVGTELDLPGGGKFKITAAYSPVDKVQVLS